MDRINYAVEYFKILLTADCNKPNLTGMTSCIF